MSNSKTSSDTFTFTPIVFTGNQVLIDQSKYNQLAQAIADNLNNFSDHDENDGIWYPLVSTTDYYCRWLVMGVYTLKLEIEPEQDKLVCSYDLDAMTIHFDHKEDKTLGDYLLCNQDRIIKYETKLLKRSPKSLAYSIAGRLLKFAKSVVDFAIKKQIADYKESMSVTSKAKQLASIINTDAIQSAPNEYNQFFRHCTMFDHDVDNHGDYADISGLVTFEKSGERVWLDLRRLPVNVAEKILNLIAQETI